MAGLRRYGLKCGKPGNIPARYRVLRLFRSRFAGAGRPFAGCPE